MITPNEETGAPEFDAAVLDATGSHILAKAAIDEFSYSMGLKSGELLQFESVSLTDKGMLLLKTPGFRRCEVHITEIAWVGESHS